MGRKAPAGVPSTPRKWFPLALSGAVCRATSKKIYELELELNVQLSASAPCRPCRWVKFGLYREADGSLPAAACLLAPTSPEKKKNWCTIGKKRNHTPREALTTVYTVAVCKHSLVGKKKMGPSLQWWSCSAGTTEEEVMVPQDRLEFQLSCSSRSRRQLCNNATQLQKENGDRKEVMIKLLFYLSVLSGGIRKKLIFTKRSSTSINSETLNVMNLGTACLVLFQ